MIMYKRSVNMALFRRSMTFLGGPNQLVPDIDEEIEDKEQQKQQKPANKQSPSSSFKSIGGSDLENILRMQGGTGEVMPPKLKIVYTSSRRPGMAPPIRRLNHDAQPLTPHEIMQHRHLLQ